MTVPEIRAIAVDAEVDPCTARRVILGEPVVAFVIFGRVGLRAPFTLFRLGAIAATVLPIQIASGGNPIRGGVMSRLRRVA